MAHDALPTPLEALADEHRLIARALAALEAYAERLERDETTPVEDLARFAAFFTEFAELWHHVKEEDILLPALVRGGFDWDTGPISHVRKDHEHELYLVRVLRQAAAQESAWSPEDRRHALAAIRAFIEFQRAHMHKEETQLFPEATRRLEPSILSDVNRRIESFGAERFKQGEYQKLRELAEALIAGYGAASTARDAT